MTQRPFSPHARLSGDDLETLRDWLADYVPETHLIAPSYSAGDLVADLDRILDGIDAMGEDA